MRLIHKPHIYIILSLVLLCCSMGFSQSKKQLQLEEKRRELMQQIRQINTLLFEGKKEQKSAVSIVEDLSFKIKTRNNLIAVTNQQTNLLTRRITNNHEQVSKLRIKIKTLKDDYAQMILKSYKSRQNKNKLMFLLSSSNFQQAYKRLQYVKQYAEYQRLQADLIQQETARIEALNLKLVKQKKEKQNLVNQNRIAKAALNKELLEQQQLIAEIKQNLSKYTLQIRKKQSETEKIDRQIQAIIREAIAASNRKAGKSTTVKTFSLTPEQQQLAANFTSNKGKLPWPVAKGVVKLRYGNNPSPIDPSLTIKSNGVRIATNTGEQVRAVFEGTVYAIMTPKNGNNTVMIRHGNYITVYKNLSKFYVSKGEKVSTKQLIGEVITNKASGDSILSFGIYKDSSTQNPSHWIYKL